MCIQYRLKRHHNNIKATIKLKVQMISSNQWLVEVGKQYPQFNFQVANMDP